MGERATRTAVRLTDAGYETLLRFELPDVCALAEAGGYRLAWDPAYEAEDPRFRSGEAPWLVRIPCRAGFIGVHGRGALSACCMRRRARLRLMELPGVMVLQQGDLEVLVTFGVEDLAEVADVLGARRRRRVTEVERARLRAVGGSTRFAGRAAVRSRTTAQDARSVGGEGVDSGVGGDR